MSGHTAGGSPGPEGAASASRPPDAAPDWAVVLGDMVEESRRHGAQQTRRESARQWAHFYCFLLLVACFAAGYCWTSMRQNEKRALRVAAL